MPSNNVSSSTIANLAARRQQVQRARNAIGLSSGGAPNGGMRSGKPINPNEEPASPTPAAPAEQVPQTVAPDALHPDNVPEMNTHEDRLKFTQKMLDAAKSGGRMITPAPKVNETPASTAPQVLDQIDALGAAKMSPVMQFMRIAGRSPSGRELAMYSATVELARQLGRNPTSNELLQYMTQPKAEASSAIIPGVNA